MRLVIAGKNSIAVDVLKHVIDHFDVQIFVVLNSTETFKNTFQKSLGFYANLWKIPVLKLDEVYKYEDVIFLSLEFDKIVKPNLFKTRSLFNVHFSLLPAYKGMYTSALPILHNEYKTGVTLHEIDAGIDTGNIIDQKEIIIHISDTARDLYTKYIKMGTELVIKNIISLVENSYSSNQQSHIKSTYYGKKYIDYSTLKINYRQTAEQILRELRAFSFREYQLPKFQNIQIAKGQITRIKSMLKPGAIVYENDSKMQVATIDYDIVLFKDLYEILWKYCELNDYSNLKKLLRIQKFDLETKTKEGWTALIISAYNGAFECLELLINHGANVNAVNYNHTTALMYAKTNYLNTDNKKCLNKLIASGSALDSKDVFGKTLLDWVKEENTVLYNYLRELV
jgi:methionyl-tRNA formyltransferase